MKICWLSSGEDQEALNLLGDVYGALKDGTIDGELTVLLMNRNRGESAASDAMIAFAEAKGIPVELAGHGEGGEAFGREWAERMGAYAFDILFVADSPCPPLPSLLESRPVLTFHSSLPSGKGRGMDDVIRRTVQGGPRAFTLAISLSKGDPAESVPVTYVSLVLEGGQIEDLYNNAYRGDSTSRDALCRLMGRCERAAEAPLAIRTLALLSRGEISIADGKVYQGGRCVEAGTDITSEVVK